MNTGNLIESLGKFLDVKVSTKCDNDEAMKEIQEGVQILAKSPAKVCNLIQRKILKTEHLKLVVLDEVDDLFGRGYKESIEYILKVIPKAQVVLTSATIPPEILEFTRSLNKDFITIRELNQDLTLDGIKQFYIALDKEDWKFDALIELLNNIGNNDMI